MTPLKPHFHIVKLGFTRVYIIFLISAQKHRLWIFVRTASVLTSTHNHYFGKKYEKFQNLMSSHNIYFRGKIRKKYIPNNPFIWSYVDAQKLHIRSSSESSPKVNNLHTYLFCLTLSTLGKHLSRWHFEIFFFFFFFFFFLLLLLLFYYYYYFIFLFYLFIYLFIYFFFLQKTGFDVSCKLSLLETICMKCQIMFSEGRNKNNNIMSSAE